jgi:hypothetical protein
MRERIARYRDQTDDPRQDYLIECRILTQPFFLRETEWIPAPQSWSARVEVPVTVGLRLLLPEIWTGDEARLERAGVSAKYRSARAKSDMGQVGRLRLQ